MKYAARTHLFLVLTFPSLVSAQIRLYPAPQGIKPSSEYRVWVNGVETFVYDSPVPASFCSFESDHPVEITIKVNRDVKWADVRPLSSGVHPELRDSSIRFRLSGPAKLSIEVNGKPLNPLFLFAQPIARYDSGYNIHQTIRFKAGSVYYPGIIHLRDSQQVFVEGGAVVVGAIEADKARHIRIAGPGIFIGTHNRNFNDSLVKGLSEAGFTPMTGKGQYRHFVQLNHCRDVTIEGPVFLNSTSWQLVPLQCRGVTIRNVKIISDQPSDDGIDIVHSQQVRINDCFIRTKDDCIAVKSYLNDSAAKGSSDVEVTRSVFWNAAWGNALEIGFELNASELSDIRFVDCDIIHVEAGAAFSIHNAGRAVVQDVLFDDIRVEDARHKLFDLAILRSRYSNDAPETEEEQTKWYLHGAWDGVLAVPPGKHDYYAQFRGKIRNVRFRNIHVVDGGLPFSIFYGFDAEHDVSGVLIENLRLYNRRLTTLQQAKCYLENARNISIR